MADDGGTTRGPVEVAWPSIRRALSKGGHTYVYLLANLTSGPGGLRPSWQAVAGRDAMTQALDAVGRAVTHASAVVTDEDVDPRGITASPKGPVISFHHIGHDEDFRAWLSAFADHLGGSGWQGRVGPTTQSRPPRWVEPLRYEAHMTAYLGMTPTKPLPRGHEYWGRGVAWSVDVGTVTMLCRELLTWIGRGVPDPEVYLHARELTVRLAELPSDEVMGWTVLDSILAGLTVVAETTHQVRTMEFTPAGQIVCQMHEPDKDWRAEIEDIRAVLTGHPEHLNLAFVRRTKNWAHNWRDLGTNNPSLPFQPVVTETKVSINEHLWARHTPDAHGIQVLTREHLDRASSLADWHVKQLSRTRYLVEARSLAPWYAGDAPDPDTLTRARADFGDMLLTPEAIAADPR